MILSWFDTRAIDAFVDGLVRDFIEHHPPAALAAEAPSQRKREARQRKALDLILRQAADYARAHRPNLYQKARLANRFKWSLREAKYPAGFVDEFAMELASAVARAGAARG